MRWIYLLCLPACFCHASHNPPYQQGRLALHPWVVLCSVISDTECQHAWRLAVPPNIRGFLALTAFLPTATGAELKHLPEICSYDVLSLVSTATGLTLPEDLLK